MENNTIRIGTIYNLKEQYKANYTHCIIEYDTKTNETIVSWYSNWNSMYNKVERIKHTEPLAIGLSYLNH